MSNGEHVLKLQPQEVGVPTYTIEAHKPLVLHLLGLGFWMFKVFLLIIHDKKN